MSSKTLFIDTNIFLHYKSFDEIDWLSILEASQVEIRIPSIVIQELDKHKYSNSSKLREKATKIIRKLHNLVNLVDSRNNVSLRENIDLYFDVENKVPDLKKLGLDYDSQDDRLLANIILYKNENLNTPTILVAADLGLRLKAKFYKIEAICLPDSLRAPLKLDENEKRIKELEREILELSRKTPELKLCFSDNNSKMLNCEIKKFHPKDCDIELIIQNRINKLKKEYPKMVEVEPDITDDSSIKKTLSNIYEDDKSSILPSEIINYNNKLEQFYIDYEKFIKSYIEWNDFRSRSIVLEISISNSGTCPAEDIDINMHFPDGFVLRDLLEIPSYPEEIEPPVPPTPRTQKERIRSITDLVISPAIPSFNHLIQPQSSTQPNVSSPDIRHSNSYDVEIHVQRIKQNIPESFDPMIITFDSFENASSFGIDYTIIAANVPTPVLGKLHVILSKNTDE